MHRRVSSLLLLLALPSVVRAQGPKRLPVPSAFAPISAAVSRELSGRRAFSTVAFVEQFYRLPGNRGFDASIDTVAALLRQAGYVEEGLAKATDRLTYRIESRPMPAPRAMIRVPIKRVETPHEVVWACCTVPSRPVNEMFWALEKFWAR